MSNKPEKPGGPGTKKRRLYHWFWFWAALTIVGGALYPLSMGPACWLVYHGYMSQDTYIKVYTPVQDFIDLNPLGPGARFITFWVESVWLPAPYPPTAPNPAAGFPNGSSGSN